MEQEQAEKLSDYRPGQGAAIVLLGAIIIGLGIAGIALANSLSRWWFRGLLAVVFLGAAFLALGIAILVVSLFHWRSQYRRDHTASR